MSENKKILVYGLSETEMAHLRGEGLHLHEIHQGNAGGTLGELIENKEVPHVGESLGVVKIMIYCGFEADDHLKELITKIRKEYVFGSIMALITKTNISWRFDYMIEHLLEEREENRQIEKERRAQQQEKLG